MINKIINEWTYQLDSGYPTKESDYEVLRTVLQETNMLSEQEIDRTIYQAKGLNEQDEDFLETMTKELLAANVKQPVINSVIQTYNTLSPEEKIAFKENFRTHSVESYVNGEGYKAFIKFWPIKGGDQGSGEVPVTLGVAGSSSGGNQEKDIKLKNGETWEVKELTPSNYDFDPAGDGDANKFPFTYEIRDFYKNIIEPYSELGDVFNTLSPMVDTESHGALKRMIQILDDRFANKKQNPQNIAIFREVAMGFFWKHWYLGFKELNQIFYQTKLDTDVRDTRITTNQDGDKQSYWVSDDEAEKFKVAASTNKPITINIGDAITDENRDVVIWFKRLERSMFIKDPSYLIQQLQNVKNTYFAGINPGGIIWYFDKQTTPHIGQASEFVISNVTKGNFRFKLKKYVKDEYTFMTDQS
jgi:hypothetical protein